MSGQVRDSQTPVAANLRAELERTGTTNTELARALGVSERQITRWRAGQEPRHEFVRRMAAFFGRDAGWFYAHADSERAA